MAGRAGPLECPHGPMRASAPTTWNERRCKIRGGVRAPRPTKRPKFCVGRDAHIAPQSAVPHGTGASVVLTLPSLPRPWLPFAGAFKSCTGQRLSLCKGSCHAARVTEGLPSRRTSSFRSVRVHYTTSPSLAMTGTDRRAMDGRAEAARVPARADVGIGPLYDTIQKSFFKQI